MTADEQRKARIAELQADIAAHMAEDDEPSPAEGDDTPWTEQPQIVRNLLESCANWLESRSHCQMLRIQPDPEEGGGYASLMREYAKNLRELNAVLTANPPPKGMPDGYKLLEDGKTMIPEDWTPLRLEWEPGYPEDVACGPARAMERLKKWLDAYFRLVQQRMTPAPAPVDERPAVWVLKNPTWNSGAAHYGAECPPGWVGMANAEPFYRRPAQAPAVKAEAGEVIDASIAEWIEAPTVYERAAFRKGFRAAERRYGIGSQPPVQGSNS